MRTPSPILALPLWLAACAAPLDHPEFVSFTISPTQVQAGGTVVATVEIENFTLTGEEDHDHDHDAGHDDYSPNEGHVHVYLDDFTRNPVAQMVTRQLEIEIPEGLDIGMHTLVARLHDGGHFIIEPQVIAEAELEIIP